MISFIWAPGEPLPAGTGGSENYTVGQVRELHRRGIAAQVVTTGLGVHDGRDGFPGVPFHSVARPADVGEIDGTLVFVTEFPAVRTRRSAFQMLHVPPPTSERRREAMRAQTRDRHPVATSRFAARLWADFLDVDVATIDVVHPFAETVFAAEPRSTRRLGAVRVLYAGRLSPEKGIYTLLSMLHHELITDLVDAGVEITFTVTAAGADKPQGAIIHRMLEAHAGIRLIDAARTPEAMAALMAEHDVVLMPSNGQYWHETFGIVSIEAQHAGCRVVASDDGGLPETDCGLVTLVPADDASALAVGLRHAIALGPAADAERVHATTRFTLEHSVDELVDVLGRVRPPTPAQVVDQLEALAAAPSPPPRLLGTGTSA